MLKFNFFHKNRFKNFLEINYKISMIIFIRFVLNNESILSKRKFITVPKFRKKLKRKTKKFLIIKSSEFNLNLLRKL
jgi:hypothetical protein